MPLLVFGYRCFANCRQRNRRCTLTQEFGKLSADGRRVKGIEEIEEIEGIKENCQGVDSHEYSERALSRISLLSLGIRDVPLRKRSTA